LQVLPKSGQKQVQFLVLRIGVDTASHLFILNFGKVDTHVYMIGCVLRELPQAVIGNYLGTTRSLSP
jgi:hypothetical protein